MTPSIARILVVDDVPAHAALLVDELCDHGYAAQAVHGGEAALEALAGGIREGRPFAMVVSDLRMPGVDGFDLLATIRARGAEWGGETPAVILLTGFGTVDQAVQAMRAGADDFLTKPVHLEHFLLTVGRVLELRGLRREREGARRSADFHGMVGDSEPMQRLFETLRRMARAEGAVLIEGESGTGKELVARALHAESARSGGPFVAVNCGGIPETLLESELFGHVAGAFSGARGARRGLFASADGGTLFLDEIGELPAAMQAKLLRVLQDGRVRPVGADRETQVDVRIVAATHQDLRVAQQDGRFREDLYYRLQTFRLRVPPLRERGNDVLRLFTMFVEAFGARRQPPIEGVSAEALSACLAYRWPGNVRELRSVAERVATLATGRRIELADLPEEMRAATRATNVAADIARDRDTGRAPAGWCGARPEETDGPPPGEDWSLEAVERRHIERVLAAARGNRTLAARWLGIGRKTLYRRLRRWGVDEGPGAVPAPGDDGIKVTHDVRRGAD